MTEATRQKRIAYTREWRKRNPQWVKDYTKEYHKQHPGIYRRPEIIESQRRYKIKNSEKLKAYFKNRYELNKEAHAAKCRAYYLKNRDKVAETNRQYVIKNKDAVKLRSKNYRNKNSEKILERVKSYAQQYPERVRAYKKKYHDAHKREAALRVKIRRAKLKDALITEEKAQRVYDFYSWMKNQDYVTCTYCGAYIPGSSLQVDHIIPVARGGDHDPDNFAVSCRPCNLSKSDFLLSEWRGCPEKFKGN